MTVDYTATDNEGRRLDDGRPMHYLHGCRQILPALEDALEGAAVSERRVVTLSPEEAYGSRMDELVFDVAASNFPEEVELRPGMVLRTHHQDRNFHLKVVRVTENRVVVDGNHPLAGRTLHFDCRVRAIRPGTGSASDLARERPAARVATSPERGA